MKTKVAESALNLPGVVLQDEWLLQVNWGLIMFCSRCGAENLLHPRLREH